MPKLPAKTPSHLQSCRDSLGDYYLALNPAYEYVDYQQERMIPALEAVERGEIERLMIFMPAGHSKTEIATKAFVPWFLSRNPNKNTILVCHTDPLAKDFGGHIRDTMTTSDAHMAIFPEVRVNNQNRASNFFRTNKGNSFYAFGMDGGVTGRRGDLLVIDDPIKTLDDALSDTVQNQLYNTYSAVLKDRMRPGFRIVVAMTRWSVRDLAARILEAEGKRWKVLVLRAEEIDAEGKGTGKYLWESFYGKERYEEAKEDDFIWNAKWQQAPTAFISQPFQQEWLRFYLPAEAKIMYRDNDPTKEIIGLPTDFGKLVRHNSYVFVDPALGKGSQHDRTCILVVVAGPERKLFWVDGVLDRLDPTERINQLVRLCRLWKPEQVVYEEYGLVADTHFLEKRFKDENISTPILSVGRKAIKGMAGGGRLKKHDRIMQLQSDFRDGRIWIPRHMRRKLLDGSEFDLVKYAVEREVLPYAGDGSIAHDEFLDTLSRIHDPDVNIVYATRDDEDEYDYSSSDDAGTSWEGRY